MASLAAVFAVLSALLAGSLGPVVRADPVAGGFSVAAQFRPNDPFYIDQWGDRKVLEQPGVPNPPNAWDVTLGSPSVVVAVVDTGVWYTHQDIAANMWVNPLDGTTHGYDFINNNANPMDVDTSPSPIYHGTGVAGVIAAVIDNGVDISGVANVKIIAVRALGANGQGSSQNTSQAIRWAADHGAKVINLSLGTNETFIGPTDISLAVDYAWRRGALVVAAAGNSASGTLDYPARLANVVSVAAIDETGSRASFSNYGSGLSLAAPGTRILTLDGNDQVHYLQGTSFSAPFVTGVAALLLSAEPSLTNVDLWNILNSSAVQPGGGTGYNTNYGWGVVNAWNAINALKQPLISLYSYPTSASRSSTFAVTWKVLGPAGLTVSDTHVVWGTASSSLGNSTPAVSGATGQSFTATGLSIPSGADSLFFKVVARVNGTLFESPVKHVTASNVPDFLLVLYQLLASNLLYLALFILVLAAVVAFIPQRRTAKARRAAAYPPRPLYPAEYYAQAAHPSQPPPGPTSQPSPGATPVEPQTAGPPPVEFTRPTPTPPVPSAPFPASQAKKRCPNCGTMVSAENLFCFFCGHPFR